MTPAATAQSVRAHRSVATWLSGAGATVTTALVGFIATPLLVSWLGDPAWGAWTVVAEWLGYLSITQMALGPGAANIFLLRAATGAAGELTAMAKRWLRLYAFAALVLTPFALALAWWAPDTLHPSPELLVPLRLAVAILAVACLALAPLMVFRSILEVNQRGYVVRAALLTQSLLITALSLLLVWWGWGLVGMAVATCAGLVVSGTLWARGARRWLPEWRRTAAARVPWSEIWHLNWPLLAVMAGNQLNLLTDNTVVGFTLGPAAVAGFALTQTLPLLAGNHLADIGGVSWAALGELHARGDATFGARVIELSSTVLGTGLAVMAAIAALTPGFVRLWVGERHFAGVFLTWATAAAMVVFAFICFFGWMLDTQGDTRHRLVASSIGSALNLALSLILIRVWGLAGVALGTLIAYLATDAWYMPQITVRRYGVPGRALARALTNALLRGGVWVMLAAAWSWSTPAPGSWLVLAMESAAWGLATAAYCWVAVLRPADRDAWRSRWQGLRLRLRRGNEAN